MIRSEGLHARGPRGLPSLSQVVLKAGVQCPTLEPMLDALARFLQDPASDDVQETGWGGPEPKWDLRPSQGDETANVGGHARRVTRRKQGFDRRLGQTDELREEAALGQDLMHQDLAHGTAPSVRSA